MLPEQSSFTFQSLSQLQVPSLQKPWELQSSSRKQTYAREIKRINLNIPINRKYSFKFESDYCGVFQKMVRTWHQVLPRNYKEEKL